MRIWLYILFGLPLMLTGCFSGTIRTAAAESPAAAIVVPLPDDKALSTALARFAQGRLLDNEQGQDSLPALESYRQALAADPGNHDLASQVAVSALHCKDPQTAVAVLEASYKTNSADYRRTVDLAAIYQATGRNDDAVVYYRKALDIDSTPTAVYIALARLSFLNANDSDALASLADGHLKADEPHLIGIYLSDQAKQFISNNELTRAIPCFELLKTWSEVRTLNICLILAELYSALNRSADAEAILREAMAMPEPPSMVFTALALVIQPRSPEEAMALLKTARKQFADSPNALFSIGVAYGEMKQHEQAIELLIAARAAMEQLDASSVLSETYFLYLGASLEQVGKGAEAEAVFNEGLALYPDSHRMLNYLAYMWAQEDRNLEQALQYSVRALTLELDNGAYTDTLGWIHYRLKQFALALETVTRARQLAGDDAEILLHLGDIMAALDRQDDAVAFWKLSLDADPSTANRAAEQLILHGITPTGGK